MTIDEYNATNIGDTILSLKTHKRYLVVLKDDVAMHVKEPCARICFIYKNKVKSGLYSDFVLAPCIDSYDIKSCTHEFKHYIGLIQEFDFCIKCDFKRSK